MPNFHINHQDFESATLISNYPTLTPLASAGYYAVDNSYRYWNGASFDTEGLEACTSFAQVSKPTNISKSINSLTVKSRVLVSGANADAADPDLVPFVGFIWGKKSDFENEEPTIVHANASYHEISNKDVGEYFQYTIPNLQRNTIYKVRAYGKNGAGLAATTSVKFITENSYAHDLCTGNNSITACTSCSVFSAVIGCQTIDSNGDVTAGYPQKCNSNTVFGISPGACGATTSTQGTVYWGDVGDDGTIREGTTLYADIDKSATLPAGEYYYGIVAGGQSVTVNSSGVVTDLDACDCP